MSLPVILNAVLTVAVIAFVAAEVGRSLKRRARKAKSGFLGAVPVPVSSLEEIDTVFKPGAFGPGLETEIFFVGKGHYRVLGGTSDAEAWILAVLSKRALRMFEFGTCTGKTTYLWARNSPEAARVFTLTLRPQDTQAYCRGPQDGVRDMAQALQMSAFDRFLYTGTSCEPKIEQLFGDSKHFDESPFVESMDLIFIDGSHAYSYVKSDTEKALRMIKPGGVILWHDYRGPLGRKGTDRALIEYAKRLPLKSIDGTSLVVYRAPAHG